MIYAKLFMYGILVFFILVAFSSMGVYLGSPDWVIIMINITVSIFAGKFIAGRLTS